MKKSIILILLQMVLLHSFLFSEVLFEVNFADQKNTDSAKKWLKDFKVENNSFSDFDEVTTYFKDQKLYFKTPKDTYGLAVKEIDLEGAQSIEIVWGVEEHPDNSNWQEGQRKSAVSVILSFGKDEIDSGAFFMPNVPYFLGISLGKNALENKLYKSSYYHKGGRYICSNCGEKAEQESITRINLKKQFEKAYGIAIKPISGISFEVDTAGSTNPTLGYIKSIKIFNTTTFQ